MKAEFMWGGTAVEAQAPFAARNFPVAAAQPGIRALDASLGELCVRRSRAEKHGLNPEIFSIRWRGGPTTMVTMGDCDDSHLAKWNCTPSSGKQELGSIKTWPYLG